MGIGKIAFSGLRYLFGKGAKTVVKAGEKAAQKVAPKVVKKANIPIQNHAEFIKQTSIYDPNNPFYLHRLF